MSTHFAEVHPRWHPIEDIESYLNDDDLKLFRTTSDDGLIHVWEISVDGTWRNVERNDTARSSTTMGRSSREAKSSKYDVTPTLRSISGRSTSTTVTRTRNHSKLERADR